jgi:hypothetical protein
MSTQFVTGKRTLSTGDYVISVSEIFDKLQSKVDANTLEQLLRDIISERRPQVRPGELITAELINQILAELESLEGRVLKLETAVPTGGTGGGTETPATGFIEARYKESPRGVQVVPNDAAAYPHTFTVVNNTDRTLNIQLNGTISGAAHGDWSKSVQILGAAGGPISSLSLASGASQDITASVKVPAAATLAEKPLLTVNATVGEPHNKQAHGDVEMTVSSTTGGAVTRSLKFNQALPPGNTDNVAVGTPMPYVFDIRYAATQAPFTASCRFTATLTATPPETLGDWFVDFSTAPRNVGGPGEVFTPLTLNTNDQADTRVTVRVRTPFAKGTVDKTAILTVKVESTDPNMPQPISATSGPFNLRLRKG